MKNLNDPKQKWYGGNNPNSPDYDSNIPVGYNRWDAEEVFGDDEETDWPDNGFGEGKL